MHLPLLLWNYHLARRGSLRWKNRDALEAWQDQQVRRHLQRVLPHSPWLRERFGSLSPAEWRSVPAVGKTESVAAFDTWNTAGILLDGALEIALRAERTRDFQPQLRGFTVGLSSGTSGGRSLFLASPHERAAWAGAILGKLLPLESSQRQEGGRKDQSKQADESASRQDWVPSRHRIALFLRSGGGLYEATGRGRVQFRWFDLMEPWESHWESLIRWQPTIIVAPPPVLMAAMQAQLSIHPSRWISCAETLDHLDRQILTRELGQMIHEVYQATEGCIACTDPSGILRLNEDLMVVEKEWLDRERTRFVPVLTDFRRYTQPVIRHRLDDVLVIADASCGGSASHGLFQALEKVEGRFEDVLFAGREPGHLPVFGDSVVRALHRAAHLQDFRVWQTAANQLRVASLPDDLPTRNAVSTALSDLWARHGGGCLQIHWNQIPKEMSPGNKRRRIRQEVSSS